MIVKVFKYPTENGSFQDEFLLSTSKFVSYEYTRKWVGTGNFTLVLPMLKDFLKIVENCILCIDGDWLFVNNIKRDEKQIEISGTDLNGFLDLRITAFGKTQASGADGYDVVKGTTGECINHYINNNAVNPEDANRKIPRLVIGQTAKGKDSDSYMARLKMLSEVVGNLCLNATIGYEIVADLDNNRFVFNTLTGTDRSIEQSDNNYVILSQKRNNLYSATYERGNEDLLNAIYATGADVTQTVYRDSTAPTGILRRECAVDVSVESVSDIKDYALNAVSGNIANNSYELDVAAVEDFGKVYKLGDYITVKDAVTGNTWTAQIVEATKTYSATEKKIKLTLGDAKTKLLNKIQNTVTLNSNSEINKSYNSMSDIAAEIKDNANKFSELTANAMGFYQTEEKQSDGSVIYYQHDKPKLADSTVIWKKSLDSFAVSTDGGQNWKGLDSDGNAVLQVISAVGIIADYIKAGTLSGVKVIATSGKIGGWTIDSGVLVSSDGTLKLNGTSNTLDIYDNGVKVTSLNLNGLKYWRNDSEIGSIAITKGANGDTYGLSFNLKNGDAMTWSVWDETKQVYVNKLRYTEENGLRVYNDLDVRGNIKANQIFGHDVVDIDLGGGKHAWGYVEE